MFSKKIKTIGRRPILAAVALTISGALFFGSCKKDNTPNPAGKFDSGVFIINEGPFQNGSGTLTFWDRATGETQQQVYQNTNNGEALGNIVQYMAVVNDQAYIVVNNAGKVVIADATNMQKTGEITGLFLPRYVLPVSSDFAFVSQWGADGISGNVAIVDLSTNSVVETIPTGSGTGHMLIKGPEMYVLNSGGFGRDSTIAIIDLSTRKVTETIVVGDNPNSYTVDKNGILWVACTGYTEDFTDPNNPLNTKGRLVKIDGDTVVASYELPNGAGKLIIDTNGSRLYYLDNQNGGNIFSFDINQTSISDAPFIAGSFYALAYDRYEETLLASDAGDFASNGKVMVYDMDGNEIRTIDAGIIPGNFWIL
jgi:YVTN family beta-propeller protein